MKKLQILNNNNEVYANNIVMGEGFAELYMDFCDRHNSEQIHLFGYNQGGYDGVAVCLKCCREISSLVSGKSMDEITKEINDRRD